MGTLQAVWENHKGFWETVGIVIQAERDPHLGQGTQRAVTCGDFGRGASVEESGSNIGKTYPSHPRGGMTPSPSFTLSSGGLAVTPFFSSGLRRSRTFLILSPTDNTGIGGAHEESCSVTCFQCSYLPLQMVSQGEGVSGTF